MLEYSLPPGYRRRQPVRRPKLGPWLGVIDAIVEEDRQRPRKQRLLLRGGAARGGEVAAETAAAQRAFHAVT